MKLKTLLTTTFAMVSVYAFAYTTDTETKLRHLVGEIISLNTSTWSDDKIISIDTLWIKPIKDKRKAKKGKHYTIHIKTKFIKEFNNKKFYVQEVKDELEIYLINKNFMYIRTETLQPLTIVDIPKYNVQTINSHTGSIILIVIMKNMRK